MVDTFLSHGLDFTIIETMLKLVILGKFSTDFSDLEEEFSRDSSTMAPVEVEFPLILKFSRSESLSEEFRKKISYAAAGYF
jgi:hypothetical protein